MWTDHYVIVLANGAMHVCTMSMRCEVVDRDRGKDDTGTWGTDTMTFQDDELSYALGKQGGVIQT